MKVNKMGRLIIDGNSFFEIDEECIKKKRIQKDCGLDKYLNEKDNTDINEKEVLNKNKRGNG